MTSSRYQRWIHILTKFEDQTGIVAMIEERMAKKHPKITIDAFAKALQALYGDFSDNAAHNVPLPKIITQSDIDNVLEMIGLQDDDFVGDTLDIIIKSFKNVPKTPEQENAAQEGNVIYPHNEDD
jgi:hypothetical protein